MASIKLGQLMSLANKFSGNALSNQQAASLSSRNDDLLVDRLNSASA